MRNSKLYWFSGVILVLVLSVSPLHAADKKASKEREMQRRMQIAQQKLADEKAALEMEKTDLAQQVGELTKLAESAKQGAAHAERKRGALEKELATAKIELTSLQEKLRQGESAQAELALRYKQDNAKSQKEIAGLQASLEQRGKSLNACEEKNAKLYELNREIVSQYRNKGLLDSLLQAEPFTGIKSVEVENTLEDYRDKLSSQRVEASK